MRFAASRIPSLIALFTLALTLAGPSARAADDGRSGAARKSAIRVGCGTLEDSQGRTVSHEATAGTQAARPSYCPGQTGASPPAQSAAEIPPTPAPEPVADLAPAPVVQEAAPQSSAALPAPKRPRATPRPPAPPPTAAPPPATAPQESQFSPLETSRTTQAFGDPPRLALDPVGAGMALMAGGTLLWLLRSGFAASLLLLGLPVWRDVDLLPVVSAGNLAPDAAVERRAGDDADALFNGAQRGVPPPSDNT